MRDLGSYFGAQRNAVLNAFGKATPEEEAFLDRLIEIIGSKKFRDRLRRISQAPIEASVTLGATEAARTLAVEVSFAIPTSDAALARVTNHLDLLGKGIENTTIADIRRVVTGSLEAGASHAEMRTALGELFDGYEDWRLDRIARTETAAAYNLGGLGQYRSAGVLLVTVVDGDADEICAPWNGREHVPLEEAEGAPLGHPNCTRSWIPEVGDGFGQKALDGEDVNEAQVRSIVREMMVGQTEYRMPQITVNPTPVTVNPTPVTIEAPIVNYIPPAIAIPAPIVNVPAPIVNVASETPDMVPVADAIKSLRSDMSGLRAEVRRPRTRKLVRDDLGRVTGATEE